jgi:hypothetical protein
MLAMSGALLVQVNVTPLRDFPLESWAVAVNVSWALMPRKLVVGLMTITASVPVEEPPHPTSSATSASIEHKRCAAKRELGSVAEKRVRIRASTPDYPEVRRFQTPGIGQSCWAN